MDSTSEQMISDVELKDLFRKAMKGEWVEVVEKYKSDPRAHKAKITKSGDTALHIAVSDGEEKKAIIKELVDIISSQPDGKETLGLGNERGNTPLHLAASMGSLTLCRCIAEADPSLVGISNGNGETPFFLAAASGKKDAFLYFHHICTQHRPSGYLYSRRKDGDTILHYAITRDYFDMAFQIIHLYPELVDCINQHGLFPLHLLASKPTAFRSGSHFGSFSNIIYQYCTFVDELKEEQYDNDYQPTDQSSNAEKNRNFPENYTTCLDFFLTVIHGVRSVRLCPKKEDRAQTDEENTGDRGGMQPAHQARRNPEFFPANYETCFELFKLACKAVLVILGLGFSAIRNIQEKKQNHTWAMQVMNQLLNRTSIYEYTHTAGMDPAPTTHPRGDQETTPYGFEDSGGITFDISAFSEDQKPNWKGKDSEKAASKETPILLAAKSGIAEIVEKILELFPVAMHDENEDKKNIVLLAVENRQPDVYRLLLKINVLKGSVFKEVDKNGNSALHLAAKLGDYKPWLIPGAALQMQWEFKWYEFVKESMPRHFFPRYNDMGKTPVDVFADTHKDLVKNGGEWLSKTSESCSVVAALIATVAFATSATVPGGVKQDVGTPILEKHPAFDVFAISSLIALCCSVTALVMFLSILTSRHQEKDFGKALPTRLLLGLTSLFVSIGSMLVSFCAGHFFVVKDRLKYVAFPVYALTCLPVTFFAAVQLPLYIDLMWATVKKVPQRSFKAVL